MRIRKIENERKRENDKEWCDDNKQKGREGGREEEEEEEFSSGSSLGAPRVLFGSSWGIFGSSWVFPGAPWVLLGDSWECCGRLLWLLGAPFGQILVRKRCQKKTQKV